MNNKLRKQFDRLPDQIQRDLRQMAFDRDQNYQNWKKSLSSDVKFVVSWNELYLIMGDPGVFEFWSRDTREDPCLPIEELYNQYYEILKDEVPKWWMKE